MSGSTMRSAASASEKLPAFMLQNNGIASVSRSRVNMGKLDFPPKSTNKARFSESTMTIYYSNLSSRHIGVLMFNTADKAPQITTEGFSSKCLCALSCVRAPLISDLSSP